MNLTSFQHLSLNRARLSFPDLPYSPMGFSSLGCSHPAMPSTLTCPSSLCALAPPHLQASTTCVSSSSSSFKAHTYALQVSAYTAFPKAFLTHKLGRSSPHNTRLSYRGEQPSSQTTPAPPGPMVEGRGPDSHPSERQSCTAYVRDPQEPKSTHSLDLFVLPGS